MSFTSETSSWRDVYIAAGARAVSVCGDFLSAVTLALVLQQRGHAGFAVSGLLIAAALPPALLGSLAGRLADRADSRTLLVAVGFAQALVAAVLAFTGSPIAMIGLVALLACGLTITQPTLTALTPAMVRPEDLPKASGLGQTAASVGALAAPALAGFLVGQVGARPALLADAVSYLAVVAAGLLLRTRRHGSRGPAEAATAWRVRSDRTLTALFVAIFAAVLGVGAVNVFEIFFIRGTLGASTTVFGLVAAAWTAGMLAGAATAGRLPAPRFTPPAAVLAMIGTCVVVIAAGAVGSAYWMIPLWIVGGMFNGVLNVMAAVIVANRVAPEARGRAYAIMNAVAQSASMIGFLVAGPLVAHFSPRLLVMCAGAAGVVAASACLPMVRRESSLSRPTSEVPVEPDTVTA
jgi:MFS family permease